MGKKFAKLVYADERENDDILFNKPPKEAIDDWYIKKYNPFKAKKIKLLGENGYIITLAFSEDLVRKSGFTINDTIRLSLVKTIDALREYGVEIVLPPDNLPFFIDTEINVAKGLWSFPFFIYDIVIKTIKRISKDIRDCEFLILNGNDDLSLAIIQNIFMDINYLTVIDSKVPYWFDSVSEDIFHESGLNVELSHGNREIIRNADIIINTNYNIPIFDYHYCEKAVFIDVSGNRKRLLKLMDKRKDMIFINDITISGDEEDISLKMLDMILHVKSREYKDLKLHGYDWELVERTGEIIKIIDPKIRNIRCFDKASL